MPKSVKERQAEYVEAQRKRGMVKTCVWVPEGEQHRVQTFANGLKKVINTNK